MSDLSIFFRTWRLISTVPTLLISEIISSYLSTISFGRGSSQLCSPLHTSYKINLSNTVSGANRPRGSKRLVIVFSTTFLVSGSELRFASCSLKSNFTFVFPNQPKYFCFIFSTRGVKERFGKALILLFNLILRYNYRGAGD